MAIFRIIKATGQKNFDCVSKWLASPPVGTDGTPGALVLLVGPDAGELNGAKGTDPANNTWFWGVRQSAPVAVACDVDVFAWDGATEPLEKAAGLDVGPKPYTTGDALEAAASDVASKAASAVQGAVSFAQVAVPVALITVVFLATVLGGSRERR